MIVQKREKLNHRRRPWFLDSIKHSFMGHVGIGITGKLVIDELPDVCLKSFSLLVVILVFPIFSSGEVLPEGFVRRISEDVGDIIKELGSVPFEGLGCFIVFFDTIDEDVFRRICSNNRHFTLFGISCGTSVGGGGLCHLVIHSN